MAEGRSRVAMGIEISILRTGFDHTTGRGDPPDKPL